MSARRPASPLVPLLPRVALADLLPSPGVREARVVFGMDPRQYALTFVPGDAPPERPWVYFLHPGSWQNGSPRQYVFVGRFFASRGFPAVLGGYRLAPQHRWPAQLEDAEAGVRASLSAEAGLAGRPLVLAGYSAGGQIAAMLALTHPPDLAVAGLLTVAAPLDLGVFPSSPLIETLTGHGPPWPEADPVGRVSPAMPRTLVVQGELDDVVPLASATSFARTAEVVAPGRVEVLAVPWMQHADAARLFLTTPPESAEIVAWLEARSAG